MSDDNLPPFSSPAVQRKKIIAAFDGGLITSDGGVMLLAQAERRLGVAERLAQVVRTDAIRTRYGEDGRRLLQFFQWVLIFEQSINHGRGPRWWPQIGAAATWLRPSAR